MRLVPGLLGRWRDSKGAAVMPIIRKEGYRPTRPPKNPVPPGQRERAAVNNQPVELKLVCERCLTGPTVELWRGRTLEVTDCPRCGGRRVVYRVEHPRKGCV